MGVCRDNALVVQSDCNVLLELHSPRAEEAREAIATLGREDTREGDVFALIGPNGSMCPGEISNVKTGSPPPYVWRSAFP